MVKINKYWFGVIIILTYCALIYFILRTYNIDYTKIKDIDPNIIREKIRVLGFWIPLAYIIFYMLRPLIFFPATILTILAGVIFGYYWGMAFALTGAMASAAVEFFFSRYYCRRIVNELIGRNNLLRIDKAVQKHGFQTVLLIRLIPNVAFDIQNFSLGITDIKFKDYFFGTLLGIIPITYIYVYLGHSFIDFRYMGKIIFFLIILVFIYFIQKYLKKRDSIYQPKGF